MTVSEAVVAATLGGAAALRRSDVGRIVVGDRPTWSCWMRLRTSISRTGRAWTWCDRSGGEAAHDRRSPVAARLGMARLRHCARERARPGTAGRSSTSHIDLANQRPSHPAAVRGALARHSTWWNPQVPTFGTCVQSTRGRRRSRR